MTSLIRRLLALGALISSALLLVAALLLEATGRTQAAFNWIVEDERIVLAVDELVADVRDAESGQRGYLLTRSPRFMESFNEQVASAESRTSALAAMVRDDAAQAQRVARLGRLVAAKSEEMRVPIELARTRGFDAAAAHVERGRGRTLMAELDGEGERVKAAQMNRLDARKAEAQVRAAWTYNVIGYGGPLLALLFGIVIALIVRSIRRPLDELADRMEAFAGGDLSARATVRSGLKEIDGLADAYNRMAEQLAEAAVRQVESDRELQTANRELKTRGDTIELLGGMAHRMQASRTSDELAEVLRCFLPRVLSDVPGALYTHNSSRNLLVQLASWGGAADLPDHFEPSACWALRRGQGHSVGGGTIDVRCGHVAGERAYHCEPVLAGGEVIGLLYLEGAIAVADRTRLEALTENVALALVNHRLQRGLREQSIRDPLTGLFNRRYMEETLAVEVARARRGGQPLSLIMCDVDHFKRFNDEFGHAAGDLVLKTVATALADGFREGDVVCRYGGEEFAVIAPSTDIDTLARRADQVREVIAATHVRHGGQSFARVTMSFGVATLGGGDDGDGVMRAADAALYRAKEEGRNRVVTEREDRALLAV